MLFSSASVSTYYKWGDAHGVQFRFRLDLKRSVIMSGRSYVISTYSDFSIRRLCCLHFVRKMCPLLRI